MDIDKLEDRELDAKVAELMGMPFRKPGHGTCCTCQTCGWDYDNCQCYYSTDIAAAMLVVEKMKFRGKMQQTLQLRWAYEHDAWKWEFSISGIWATADTAPLAICLAALKAVEAE